MNLARFNTLRSTGIWHNCHQPVSYRAIKGSDEPTVGPIM